MTRKQDNAREQSWKEQLAGQEDFIKSVVQAVLQQVLEQEMEEALQAGKYERTAERLGYRSGSYGRTLITRVGRAAGAARPARTVSDRDFRAVPTE